MSSVASITASEVYGHASKLIQQYLGIRDFSNRCGASVIIAVVLYAAARVTSISDACKCLESGPSDETMRQALLATLPGWQRLQRQLNAALSGELPKSLRRRPQRVAFDIHEVPYHGQPQNETREIRRSKPRRGTTHFHDYATAYVVHAGYRFTIAMVWVRQDDSMVDVVRALAKEVHKAHIKIRVLLMDRGFYNAAVVRYLQAARTPFLMPLKAPGRLPKDPAKIRKSARRFFHQKVSGYSSHTWCDKNGMRATVQVCISCRNYAGWKKQNGRYALVYAYWGLQPSSIMWIRHLYRKRFGIETSYRQMEQARVRTSSRDPLRRLFFAGVALVLRNTWVWLHLMKLSSRHGDIVTLHLGDLRFRHLLQKIEKYVHVLFPSQPIGEPQMCSYSPLASNVS